MRSYCTCAPSLPSLLPPLQSAAQAVSTEEVPIKVQLIAPPLYVMTTQVCGGRRKRRGGTRGWGRRGVPSWGAVTPVSDFLAMLCPTAVPGPRGGYRSSDARHRRLPGKGSNDGRGGGQHRPDVPRPTHLLPVYALLLPSLPACQAVIDVKGGQLHVKMAPTVTSAKVRRTMGG